KFRILPRTKHPEITTVLHRVCPEVTCSQCKECESFPARGQIYTCCKRASIPPAAAEIYLILFINYAVTILISILDITGFRVAKRLTGTVIDFSLVPEQAEAL